MAGVMSIYEVDKRLSIHEEVCTVRQGQILARVSRLERIMLGFTATLLCGMCVVIWQLFVIAAKIGGGGT